MSDKVIDHAAVAAADAVANAAEDAAFASGFPEKGADKPGHKATDKLAERPGEKPGDDKQPEAEPAPKPAPVVVEKPEYQRVLKKDWDALVARTTSHEAQFSKAFGTIGNMQKLVNGLQAGTPTGRKVEIPKEAFAAMAREFPELAELNRTALQSALEGMTGTGGGAAELDETRLEHFFADRTVKRELKNLADEFPDWQQIVGAVAVGQAPDLAHPYRKWLATKDASYQARVNASESADVIARSIRLFQREINAAKPAPGQRPRDEARVARIAGAMQPRGDNAGVGIAAPTDDEQFEAGFNSR
jgi:hypothetical protein